MPGMFCCGFYVVIPSRGSVRVNMVSYEVVWSYNFWFVTSKPTVWRPFWLNMLILFDFPLKKNVLSSENCHMIPNDHMNACGEGCRYLQHKNHRPNSSWCFPGSLYPQFWVTWPPILTIMCSWADITWHQNEKSTILMTKQKILAVHFVPKMPKHVSIHAGLTWCWNKIRVKLASKLSFLPFRKGLKMAWKSVF